MVTLGACIPVHDSFLRLSSVVVNSARVFLSSAIPSAGVEVDFRISFSLPDRHQWCTS